MTDDRRYGLIGQSALKVPADVATTAAITLSGEQTIDGVACVSGDRVLVKDQTDTTTNGIYIVDTGTWSRSADCDGNYDLQFGTMVRVNQGSTNKAIWVMTSTTDPIIIGTSAITWTNFLAFNNIWTAAQRGDYSTLTSSSASIAINLNSSNNFKHTMTENTTLAAPTNAVAGQSGVIEVTQHASAAKTLGFNAFWHGISGATVTAISSTTSSKSLISYIVAADALSATYSIVVQA